MSSFFCSKVGQCDWKTCLQTILSQEAALEPETHGKNSDEWIKSFFSQYKDINNIKKYKDLSKQVNFQGCTA